MPSFLTPVIVTRVQKLYEDFGREEVKAVQEWEEKQKQIAADKIESAQRSKEK